MVQPSEIILQEKINSDQTWEIVDLYSEEHSLGSDMGLQRIKGREITIIPSTNNVLRNKREPDPEKEPDPFHWKSQKETDQIHRIMMKAITIGTPLISHIPQNQKESESINWDYYCISLPFTLHRLDGNRYYESLVFQVTLSDPRITAVDLFPQNITAKTGIENKLSISPELKIAYKQVKMDIGGKAKSSKENIITLEPRITAFGKGQHQFYWEYKELCEQPSLPGSKQAIVLLRVPYGNTKITTKLSYKAIVVEKIFGVLIRRDVESAAYQTTLTLSKFP